MAAGQLNVRTVKLGDSADNTKNFLISVPGTPDGTLTIERESGTDVLVIDASGNVNFPLMQGGDATNGYWVKLGDGTMISYHSTTASYATTTATGQVYRTSAATSGPAFPVAFVGAPKTYINAVGGDNFRFVTVGGVEVTESAYPSFYVCDTVTGTASTTVDFLAIGRWK